MRDEFLTKKMGVCSHKWVIVPDSSPIYNYCEKCHIRTRIRVDDLVECIDFSQHGAFFLLWNWAQEQKWWREFHDIHLSLGIPYEVWELIHPDRFADAVYDFLTEYDNA